MRPAWVSFTKCFSSHERVRKKPGRFEHRAYGWVSPSSKSFTPVRLKLHLVESNNRAVESGKTSRATRTETFTLVMLITLVTLVKSFMKIESFRLVSATSKNLLGFQGYVEAGTSGWPGGASGQLDRPKSNFFQHYSMSGGRRYLAIHLRR